MAYKIRACLGCGTYYEPNSSVQKYHDAECYLKYSKRESDKRYREQNKETLKEYQRRKYKEAIIKDELFILNRNFKYRTRDKLGSLLSSAKARAKSKGWDYDISREDLTIPEICPILDIPIEIVVDGKGMKDNSPSLDRIDSSKGYIKGNVRIISWRANNLLSNGTPEEFKKISEYLNGKG